MGERIKILMVEDLSTDAMLNEHEIKKTLPDYELKVVEDREEFIRLLENWLPDLVVSDYQLPAFDGLDALQIVLERTPVIPVIIVTGSQNEDTAVDCMKAGATDYVIKEHIKRLGPAITNALKKREIHLNTILMQKMLKESEEKFRNLFQDHTAVKLIIDPEDGRIVDANKAAAIFYGWSVEQLKGMNVAEINIAEQGLMSGDLESARNENVFKFKIQHKRSDESLVDVEVFTSKVKIGNKDYLHSIVHDVTEKEKLERKIAIAEESVKFKQRFLADMSHEIRTPLTAIIGVIDLLTDSVTDEYHREQMDILKSTGENLMDIVNQVLDYSKIQAGKLDLRFSAFNLNELLEKTAIFYSSTCNDEVAITVEASDQLPEFIRADKLRLSQILNNLVSNAAKFTHTGTIRIKAYPFPFPDQHTMPLPEIVDSCIRVEITDTGIGVHEELQEKLFHPFIQLLEGESVNSLQMGTGLGLSICRQLVNLHGGEIGLQSTPGEGSTFWFTFLAKKTEQKELLMPPINNNSLLPEKLKILLAEDKVFNQKVITLMLNHMGHDVVVAGHGEEVLARFTEGNFDLILMDIQMPVMDGITAVKKLREKYADLPPVVGLSANAFEGDRDKYISQGLDDYITKPLRKAEFTAMLSRVLS